MSGQHPRHRLDDLLTNGVRLSVVAALDGLVEAEFALVRDAVEVSDSELSKQVATLEAAGYVRVDKGCLLYTSPSPRDGLLSRMPSSA